MESTAEESLAQAAGDGPAPFAKAKIYETKPPPRMKREDPEYRR
jgi:hypothetical protein